MCHISTIPRHRKKWRLLLPGIEDWMTIPPEELDNWQFYIDPEKWEDATTFIFGFPSDSPPLVGDTVRFAKEQKLFLAAFAHLIPFPGTPLYNQFRAEERLVYDRWWMSEAYRFGQVPFRPVHMEPLELEQYCHQARRDFYGLSSILRRSLDFSTNCSNLRAAATFFSLNYFFPIDL